MPGSGRVRWLPVILALLSALALAGAGALFGWKWYREERVRAFISLIPGTLHAQEVRADLFSDGIELRKLSGTVHLFDEAPFGVRIGKLRVTGIHREFFQATGTNKFADTVHIEYLSFDPGEDNALLPGYSFMNVGSYTINGLWMNHSSLLRAIREGPRSDAFADFLLSLRLGHSLALDSSVKIAASQDWGEFSQNDFLMVVDRFEMQSYSLLSTGRSSHEGVALFYADGARLRVREMNFDLYTAPESSVRALVADDSAAHGETRAKMLFEEGYSLRGMECKDALLVTAEGDTVAVPLLNLDLDIGNGNVFVKVFSPEMVFTGALLQRTFSELDSGLGRLLSGPANISMNIDLRSEQGKGDIVRIVYDQQIRERELGGISMHFVLKGKTPPASERSLVIDPASVLFEKGEVTLTDGDLLRRYFAAESGSATGQGGSAGQARVLRARAAADLRNEASHMPAEFAWLKVFADFIEQSGSFRIKATAIKPVSLFDLARFLGDREYIRMEAEHRPYPGSG